MYVSQKCQYTLRALYELAKRQGGRPATVTEIAEAQAIPPRFLEVILQGLKNAGEVTSRRGGNGGYVLAAAPESVTVAKIIRLADGSLAPVSCASDASACRCRLRGQCVFIGVWQRAEAAAEKVYETVTLKDLMDQERSAQEDRYVPDYCI